MKQFVMFLALCYLNREHGRKMVRGIEKNLAVIPIRSLPDVFFNLIGAGIM